MKVEVVTAERGHCNALLAVMSEGDRLDMIRGWGMPMEQALPLSFEASSPDERWTILKDGNVIGMFGCTPDGIVWLMRSADFDAVAIRFIRQAEPYIDALVERHGEIRGFAHNEHKKLIRWLQWAGFKIQELDNRDYFQCVKRRSA